MAGPVSVFKTGLQLAIEDSEAVAPGLSSNPYWFQGGRWFDMVTDGLPTIDDRVAIIFPTGQAGRRAMNVRAPTRGRRWSDGDISYQVSSDILGLLLYGALGSMSTNRVDGTTFALLVDEPMEGGQLKSLVLSSQPSDGGAFLRFTISGASAAGIISVSGINAEGQGASEVITFSSAGSFYTRTSFSSIAASGIQISGSHAGASVNVHGIQYWQHTITFDNASNPKIGILRYGDPTAGAASVQRYHPAMTVTTLGLTNPAEQRDGVFSGTATFEGYPTATCTLGSLNSVSPISIWPAWTQAINKNGSNWYKATNFAMTINSGNRNYRAAAGVQGPQGKVYLGQEVTGSFQILVDSEEEYNAWLGTSALTLYSNWNSPYKMTSSQNEQIEASMTSLYLENISKADQDGVIVLSADFRPIEDANDGIAKFRIRNGVPGIAYGGGVA